MTTRGEARDQLVGAFRTAWLASAAAAVPLEYDDVRADTSAAPNAALRREPFARVFVRELSGEQETLGAIGSRRFLTSCTLVVQLFTATGDGNEQADVLAGIARRILRQIRNPSGVWGPADAAAAEIGVDEATGLYQTNVTGSFQYEEVA